MDSNITNNVKVFMGFLVTPPSCGFNVKFAIETTMSTDQSSLAKKIQQKNDRFTHLTKK